MALTACGGKVRDQVKKDTLLESPELNAAWHELGFRAQQAGDTWPNPLFVALNIQEMDWRLHQWDLSPGSADSQVALTVTRKEMADVLENTRQAACVQLPVYGGGHWTLLTLTRGDS